MLHITPIVSAVSTEYTQRVNYLISVSNCIANIGHKSDHTDSVLNVVNDTTLPRQRYFNIAVYQHRNTVVM